MTQQMLALNKANQHRLVQASLKRMLREQDMETGKLMAREVIGCPGPELAAMRVESLLTAVHAIGSEKAAAISRRSRVGVTRRLGDLTDNERERLDIVLCGWQYGRSRR